MKLYDYQQTASDDIVDWCTDPVRLPSDRLLLASPTGTGKSYVVNDAKRRLEAQDLRPYVVSPSDDILIEFARKAGVKIPVSASRLKSTLEGHGYYTPVRLRNVLMSGDIRPPTHIFEDETHHDESETHRLIDALCPVPKVGVTATPFRGTARSTESFRERWGDPTWIITMEAAVRHGYMSFPTCDVVPLMDDDVVEVVNGEFVVSQLQDQALDCVERVVSLVRSRCYRKAGIDYPRRPTMLTLPNVYSATLYAASLRGAGINADCVTGETKRAERDEAFENCRTCRSVLVQVRVVSEGVDLPIRCLIDLAPMMSPVQWLQQFGRVTRPVSPNEEPPEYVCCNRNILRHAYLLEGLLPPARYVAMEQRFEGPSKRRSVRAVGFEGLGKFTQTEIPLANGTKGQAIFISALEGRVVTEYAAIASPLHSDVLYARRQNVRVSETGTTYGKWERIHAIPDVTKGFASIVKNKPRTVAGTDIPAKWVTWWKNSARWYGMDGEEDVPYRTFCTLPVLKDTGFRFR